MPDTPAPPPEPPSVAPTDPPPDDTPAASTGVARTTVAAASPNIWMRGLFMLLMALAFQLASSLLGLVAVVQWVLVLIGNSPNERLGSFATSLGQYLRQIAEFEGFASEVRPFPFTDWPGRP